MWYSRIKLAISKEEAETSLYSLESKISDLR
jgi:hypothetical protein